jgi:hypothetical protein
LNKLSAIFVSLFLVGLYVINNAAATPFNDRSQPDVRSPSSDQPREPMRYNSTLYERYHGKSPARIQPNLAGFNNKNGALRQDQFSTPAARYVQQDNCTITIDNTFNDRTTAKRICNPNSRQVQAYYP